MLYYLINIQPDARTIFEYDDLESVKEAYHSTLASNYAAKLSHFAVMIIDQYANHIISEHYEKET